MGDIWFIFIYKRLLCKIKCEKLNNNFKDLCIKFFCFFNCLNGRNGLDVLGSWYLE